MDEINETELTSYQTKTYMVKYGHYLETRKNDFVPFLKGKLQNIWKNK